MELESIPPSRERRWDTDERRDGVAEATDAAARIDVLRAHAARPRWVLDDQSSFKAHGHTIRFRVTTEP